MFLKEVIEVGRLLEPQAVAYFGNVPVGMFEQRLGFAHQSFGNTFRGGFTGGDPYGAVQVVHMHGQLLCKVFGRAQGKALRGVLNGELPLQQLCKHGTNAGIGIRVLVQVFGGLGFKGKVDELHHVIAEQVVFIDVVAVDLIQHFLKQAGYMGILLGGEQIGRFAAIGVHRQLVEAIAGTVGEKGFAENAEETGGVVGHIFPGVGYVRIKEQQGAAIDLQAFIGIMVNILAPYKGDLIILAAAVFDLCSIRAYAVLQAEHVKMTDILLQVIGQEIKFILVEFL